MEQSNTCTTNITDFGDLLNKAEIITLGDLVKLFKLRAVVYDSEIDDTIDIQSIDIEEGTLIFII